MNTVWGSIDSKAQLLPNLLTLRLWLKKLDNLQCHRVCVWRSGILPEFESCDEETFWPFSACVKTSWVSSKMHSSFSVLAIEKNCNMSVSSWPNTECWFKQAYKTTTKSKREHRSSDCMPPALFKNFLTQICFVSFTKVAVPSIRNHW